MGREISFAGKKWLIADVDFEGVTLMWHDTAPEACYFNTTSNNDWSSSIIRDTLNTTFLSELKAGDSNAQNKIVQVTNIGETYSEDGIVYTQWPDSKDYVWIASVAQVFGIKDPDSNGLGEAGSGAVASSPVLFDIRGGKQFALFQATID